MNYLQKNLTKMMFWSWDLMDYGSNLKIMMYVLGGSYIVIRCNFFNFVYCKVELGEIAGIEVAMVSCCVKILSSLHA